MAKNKFVIAKRYARALWLEAGSKTEADKILPALHETSAALAKSADLRRLLKDPRFSNAEKGAVLGDILAKCGSPAKLTKFVGMLCEAGRAEILADVEEAFTGLVLKEQGAVAAVVETASALSDAQLKQVEGQIEKITGKKAVVTVRMAPELLAGIRIQVEGKTIDVSLKAQMARLEREMLKTGALAQA